MMNRKDLEGSDYIPKKVLSQNVLGGRKGNRRRFSQSVSQHWAGIWTGTLKYKSSVLQIHSPARSEAKRSHAYV